MTVDKGFWKSRRVLVTGHTGFKGSWLALWLAELGAEVHGFALAPATSPSLFAAARIDRRLASSILGDVRDVALLKRTVARTSPEVVFHLAAQALVRAAYADPVDAYATNVMGTVHVLEACRDSSSVGAIVNVTTDKCYENHEWPWGYRETDALGGRDPYASSKACSELVTAAYAKSYFSASKVGIATARAGNVIGGGDWAAERLVPDFFRAALKGAALELRHPDATRPWQHVLEPLGGYLRLAESLHADHERYSSAWNFGPSEDDACSVGAVIEKLAGCVASAPPRVLTQGGPHEAGFLKLDSGKARSLLGWRPRWAVQYALERTANWYLLWSSGADAEALCLDDLALYQGETA